MVALIATSDIRGMDIVELHKQVDIMMSGLTESFHLSSNTDDLFICSDFNRASGPDKHIKPLLRHCSFSVVMFEW